MGRTIDKLLRRLVSSYERRVLKKEPFPFGWAARLRQFEQEASEREWQQLMFYMEMISRVRDIPGDVVEFGVAGGVSLLAFWRCLRVMERGFNHKERRRLVGFDSFEGLPPLSDLDRAANASDKNMHKGGFHVPAWYAPLFRFVENEPDCLLVKGWFNETLPGFLSQNPHSAFSLVHIDCDLYESTKVVLEQVWTRVVPGGIVLFDELFHKDYPGETLAYREFFQHRSAEYTLHRSDVKPDKKYLVKAGSGPARSINQHPALAR